MFDVNLKARVTDWLGVTTITTSGETIPTTGTTEVMSGIITIQTTLADMQIKLDTLLGSWAIPVVTPTSLLASGTVSDTATATVKTSPITK